jgi:hypothetical protein
VHSNIENNKYCEIKIHHKVSNMLMHPCCHILFSVLIGFDPKCKRISKKLWKMDLGNQIRKRKNLFSSPSLLSAQSAYCLPHRAGPRGPSFFLAGPAHQRWKQPLLLSPPLRCG